MNESGFDRDDDAIRRRFQAATQGPETTLAGEGPGELTRLRGRFDAARARRRRHQIAGAAAAMVVVVGGSLSLRPTTSEVRVGAPGSDVSSTTGRPITSTTSTTTQSPTTVAPPTSAPSSSVAPSTTQVGRSVPSTTAPSAPRPPAQPGGTVRSSSPSATSSTPTTTVAPTPVEPPRRQSYSAAGGTLTADFSAGIGLSLVSTAAASGFTAEVRHNDAERIEVRYSSPTMESTIELRVVGGVVAPRIEDRPR